MASISDIRNKPKLFELKTKANISNLCQHCKEHKIIIAVKWGCDYIITSDVNAKHKAELHHFLHVWCDTDRAKPIGKAPKCFGEYKDKGYLSV